MPRFKPTLFLRNAEDSSAGGGVTPAPAPAPATNGAPQPATPSLSADDVKGMLTEFRNGLFADLRKAGALKPDKPNDPTGVAPGTTTPAAPAVPSLADIERTVETKIVIQQMRTEHGLSDAQVNYLKSHLEHSKPESVFAAAKSFMSDLGLVKAATQPVTPTQPATPNTAPAQPTTPPKPPIQTPQLGAPAPGDSRDPEAILHSRPQEATAHDFERLVAKHGEAKALQMWQAAQSAFHRTVKPIPDSRRQR